MTREEKDLIMEWTLGRIDQENFWRLYGRRDDLGTYIRNYLQESLKNKDADVLSHILLLSYKLTEFEFDESDTSLICNLIVECWHNEHEDLASILHRLKDPTSINCLTKAMFLELEYLDYNDGESLIRKCAYALANIGTEESLKKLHELSKSENPIIKSSAIEQLERKNINLPQ